MNRTTSRRTPGLDPELQSIVQLALSKAQEIYGSRDNADLFGEILRTAFYLMRDDPGRGDLKLLNSALKEMRKAFQVFAPFEHIRKVSCFGSARTGPEEADWQQAYQFAEKIVANGWMVITGAGDGIMAAAQGGAGRERSFGVNIRLPFEQSANQVIAGDQKLINFRYFFTRKVTFVKESHAIVLFPGGFGTHDEGFESLTLIQTGKSEIVPLVFVDEPGGSYWQDWHEYVGNHLGNRGLISPEDQDLYKVTDDVDVAVQEILNFYSNYHSSRYVKGRLVLRVRKQPTKEQLEQFNQDYADILTRGRIEVGSPLPEENGNFSELPRVILPFNRKSTGRLRHLIDDLNTLVPERASSPEQAGAHEIVPQQLPEGAEDLDSE